MIRVGIIGVSGYGGGEVLRICASHPEFTVTNVWGESTAGQKLGDRFPGIPPKLAEMVIEGNKAPAPSIDLLFASMPTGASKETLADMPENLKIVDIGGDHRYAPGWVYGLADVWPSKMRNATRVANPGCFPAAALAALAPLAANKWINPEIPVIIDAKTGVSGAGRGGSDSRFSFSEINEDTSAYKPLNHVHVPEITASINEMLGKSSAGITFVPHLVPMTRGIVATCYVNGEATTEQCLAAARKFYAARPFVRVVDQPPHSKWASGSNLVFVSYFAAPGRPIIAISAIDNLGKGAAGQAVQNANLMCGLPETMGLEGAPLWP